MVAAFLRASVIAVIYVFIYNAANCDESIIRAPHFDERCPTGLVPKLLSHETDCTLFYMCQDGKAFLKNCPSLLHFNPQKSECDYPESAGCTTDVIKDPRGKLEDGSFDLCPPKDPSFPVLKPHESDCGKFYICNGGVPHVKSCQLGLHFNPKVHTCDYPENAGCDSGVVDGKKGRETVFDSVCPPTNDGNTVMKPHETDCRKFYICHDGFAVPQVCQFGLHFNTKLQACDYPENAGCETRVTKIPKGKLGRDDLDNICSVVDGKSPTLKPHESDCKKFYSCNGGFAHLQTCQSGLHFNPKLQACDYPENAGCERGLTKKEPKGKGALEDFAAVCPKIETDQTVLMPHPTDCTMYFQCVSDAFYPRKCPGNLHFNVEKQVCDFPKNVRCKKMGQLRSVGVPSAFCPPVNGKSPIFYRHPSNCSIYYMCNHGMAYEFTCPSRLHFNLRLKICDYENIAGCATDGPSQNKESRRQVQQ